MEDEPRFAVGIDLGTTNSAVASVDLANRDSRVSVFPVPQWVAPGTVEARDTLPSFHYSPVAGEWAELRLPWETEPEPATSVVGVLARDHGAELPGRLIVSAKSWLSHSGVDRTAKLLPWHGAPDVAKLSPTEASACYLGHLRAAWNHSRPEFPLESQLVVLTIPASFDEVARELTVKAARQAGLPRVHLLEEPQAAFYAWINSQGNRWHEQVRSGEKVLVCDVGGGTTDFTLIEVQPGDTGAVRFHRYGVGDHLILGGDNLDLSLAHHLEKKLFGEGKLEARQWSVLVRRCQQAKEVLLGAAPPPTLTVNLPSIGSRLIGGGRQVEVEREEAVRLLVDGFLPFVRLDEKPARRQSGFQELGLPFAPDYAITRYLAEFLVAHRAHLPAPGPNVDPARPDVVLFNGGLFESTAMRDRLLQVLTSWFTSDSEENSWKPRVLRNERLDLAVAIGAAYYGLVRRGTGVRISGGLARSYYIGVQQATGPAALCLAPAGLDEGQEVQLEKAFQLRIRQPVELPLFVSSVRTTDRPGQLLPLDETQLSPLPPIRTVIQSGKKSAAAETLPVEMHARLTEIGTLEIWCAEKDGPRRWRLQFDVRSTTQTDRAAHEGAGEQQGILDDQTTQACLNAIQRTFGPGTPPLPPQELTRALEKSSGMDRWSWPPSLLRAFWECLMQHADGRQRSALHEARWLNLLGFSLRPGFGVAVDDWRVAQTWRLTESRVRHPNNELCRAEWWILWRRIAGGLVSGQQRILADPLMAAFRARARADRTGPSGRGKTSGAGTFKFGPHETQEVCRFLGSLEWLSRDIKIEFGDLLLERLRKRGPEEWGGAALWALGRVGARVPTYGPLDGILTPEVAERWIQELVSFSPANEMLGLAVMQIARRTADRYLDISDPVREQVLAWLQSTAAPPHYARLVSEPGHLRREEQGLVLGDALPWGLAV